MRRTDRHGQALQISTAISLYCVPKFVRPLRLIQMLTRARVRPILMGSHGFGGWLDEPRACQEVCVLAAASAVSRAAKLVGSSFPHMRQENSADKVLFRAPTVPIAIVCLMKPVNPLLRNVLRNAQVAWLAGRPYLIPRLEAALAAVYADFVATPDHEADKHLHAHDFLSIINANPDLSIKKLAALGELLYTGGGRELVDRVLRVRAGEKFRF